MMRYISIHAPAQGATTVGHKSSAQTLISIHAPAQGATGSNQFIKARYGYFNSRSRTGSDRKTSSHLALLAFISIHAPAQGATSVVVNIILISCISIHAPAQGATFAALPVQLPAYISIHAPAQGATDIYMLSATPHIFQFTLPHRERRPMHLF